MFIIVGIFGGQSDHYDFSFIPDYNELNENGKPLWENTTYDAHLYVKKAKQYIDTHLDEHPNKVSAYCYTRGRASWQGKYIAKYMEEHLGKVSTSSTSMS